MSLIESSTWLSNNQVDAYTGAGPLLSDDHPLTEYFMLHGSIAAGPAQALVFRLFLVVTGLLALLIIGAAVDAATQGRARGSAPPALSSTRVGP